MRKIQYILIAVLFSTTAMGQGLTDALRYSDYRIQGTARSAAMGNAFGALGGDFTSASINPAGLGVYRSSEFVFTPTIGKIDVDANYLGQMTNESKYNIGLSNIGYVTNFGNSNLNSGGSLVNFSLGLGFNRLNNFNMKKMVEAFDANSTLLDDFVANANAGVWDNSYEELAWKTDLLLKDNATGEYFNDIADAGYGHMQRKSFTQKGNIDEYLISMAANFNHRFYIGATIGIHSVNFKETTSLFEKDVNNNIPYFNDYTFNTYLNTTGTGVNVKLGAIFRPVDALRLGVAVHSPTFYRLNDRYDNAMYSYITFDDGSENFEAFSPIGDYDYDLETPMKAIFSAALVLGKSAILSADYEYVDYSTIKLGDGGDGYDFFDENKEIKAAYKAVGNIRLGAEYRLTNEFSLRGGYEHFPSPYNKTAFNAAQPNANITNSAFSTGLGYRQGSFFFDVAYKHFMNENYHELYPGSDLANFDAKSDQLIMTLGFRF